MLAAYQGEKYSTNGTSTMTMVGMAGKVRIRAVRLWIAASSRRPDRGSAAVIRVSGRPRAVNSGTTSSSRMVCTERV